jgi:outer membrane protein TolC
MIRENIIRNGIALKCFLFFLLSIFLILSNTEADEPVIKAGESLNLERCIEIALKMHPSILRDRYTVREKEAILGQAKAPYYPKLDTSAGLTRNFVEKDTQDRYFSLNMYNENLANATLDQLIYDFGKTPTDVKAKKFSVESSRFDLDDTTTAVTNNVKSAYYGVLKAKRTRDVNLETVEQYGQHLSQAKVLFEAGKKPKYDVTKAELDLSNAQLDLITAENDLKVAWVKLSNAMGIDAEVEYKIEDTLFFEDYGITLEDALNRAYQNRPDLKSLIAQKESAAKSAEHAKKNYFPTIKGKAGYNFIGSEYPLGQGWNAGVTMSLNIFEGNLTRNKVEESMAKAKSIEARIDSKKLDILLEVKQAYLNLLKAKEKNRNTEIQIRQATENLELANLRYNAGLAEPIEITDATVSYSKAKLSNISTLYDYRIEQANIEKAMGNK